MKNQIVSNNLELELKILEKENIYLKIKLQELNSLRDENTRLRKISKASNITSKKQTIVKVISNTASPNKRVISIDKGEKYGVYIGQNVIGVNGLIGTSNRNSICFVKSYSNN